MIVWWNIKQKVLTKIIAKEDYGIDHIIYSKKGKTETAIAVT